mgnify:CR=1 FL=1|jgi:hypothetical protein
MARLSNDEVQRAFALFRLDDEQERARLRSLSTLDSVGRIAFSERLTEQLIVETTDHVASRPTSEK